MYAKRSLHGALDRWVYLANWELFFDAVTTMDCPIKAINWNSGFLMCSTTDSTTPKTDVSQITHTLLLSLATGQPASSPSGRTKASAAVWFRRHNRSVCIAVRARACTMAHAPNRAHGASCVEADDTLFPLNWNGLQEYLRHSNAYRPSFAR